MNNPIYTHDEATRIVDAFDNLLANYGIKVPSLEDDEREDDNYAALYGSTYSDLLDEVESILLDMLKKAKAGAEVIPDKYSGTM